MKKSLILLSLFSLLLTSCELTIGDNVNCSCECCKKEEKCDAPKQESTTGEVTYQEDFPTDEYNVEEDTTLIP